MLGRKGRVRFEMRAFLPFYFYLLRFVSEVLGSRGSSQAQRVLLRGLALRLPCRGSVKPTSCKRSRAPRRSNERTSRSNELSSCAFCNTAASKALQELRGAAGLLAIGDVVYLLHSLSDAGICQAFYSSRRLATRCVIALHVLRRSGVSPAEVAQMNAAHLFDSGAHEKKLVSGSGTAINAPAGAASFLLNTSRMLRDLWDFHSCAQHASARM